MYQISVEAMFSAAHHLKNYDGDCKHPHGHNWKVIATFQGKKLKTNGMFYDFKTMRKLLKVTLKQYDHTDLNNSFPYIPTAENLARVIFMQLQKEISFIYSVSVEETPGSKATFFQS